MTKDVLLESIIVRFWNIFCDLWWTLTIFIVDTSTELEICKSENDGLSWIA